MLKTVCELLFIKSSRSVELCAICFEAVFSMFLLLHTIFADWQSRISASICFIFILSLTHTYTHALIFRYKCIKFSCVCLLVLYCIVLYLLDQQLALTTDTGNHRAEKKHLRKTFVQIPIMTFSCGIKCVCFCWMERCRFASGLAIDAACCFNWTVFNVLSLIWCCRRRRRWRRVCGWLCIAITSSFMFNFPWLSNFFDRLSVVGGTSISALERFVNELLPLNTSFIPQFCGIDTYTHTHHNNTSNVMRYMYIFIVGQKKIKKIR